MTIEQQYDRIRRLKATIAAIDAEIDEWNRLQLAQAELLRGFDRVGAQLTAQREAAYDHRKL